MDGTMTSTPMNDQQKLVVVTGAAQGVGRSTSLSLVRDHGCDVLAVSRNEASLATLVEEAKAGPGQLTALALDITTDNAVASLLDHIGDRRVHALVNNAGLLIKRPFGSWSDDDLQRLFATNVFAPLKLVQALVVRLGGDPPGHVVNIGSMGGYQGSVKFPGLLAYSASKAALANITECLAEELKDKGVRCNCLCLGSVDTAMLRDAFPDYTAPVDSDTMGKYIARFALEGHALFNGKVLPVAVGTP